MMALRSMVRVLPHQRPWSRFVDWFNARELSEHAVLLAFAVAIGILAALGVAAFYGAIDLAYQAFYRLPGSYVPRITFLIYRPAVTAAGLALAWYVMHRIGRGHDGMNVPDVQLAVVRRGGELLMRPALARTVASAITIGSGASAGSEGPVVVLGAAIGSWLARAFRFAPQRAVVFVGCASGAAISAAFNAPLAGAFFALEEILGGFSTASFSPVVIASVVAAVVTRTMFGNHPAFHIPREYGYARIEEVVFFYPLLGGVVALVAAFYIYCYFGAERVARWLTSARTARRALLPRAALPWLGGAVVGLMVFASAGRLVGYGHLAISLEVFGRMQWYVLLAFALGSAIATGISLNFGGSGGVFTPSLFIGAATGGAVGVALSQLFPGMHLHPEAYALVGMGAMIAGATDAPITGILLVFEMTNDSAIMLPLMLTVVIAHVVARRLEPDSLYSGWLRRRGEHLEQGADRDVMAGLHVYDVYDAHPLTIDENETIDHFARHLGASRQSSFPVLDGDGRLVGMVSVAELGQAAAQRENLGLLIVAADITAPTQTVTPGDTLLVAIRRMGVRGSDALPVVEAGTERFLGTIARHDVLGAYEQAVARTGEHAAAGDAASPTRSPAGGSSPGSSGPAGRARA